MFRTHKTKGLQRFSSLRKIKTSKQGSINLTKFQINLIESSTIISLAEKIELFLLSLGNKLTTELYMRVEYNWSIKDKKEIANNKDLLNLENLLSQLPFEYFKDSLSKKNRQNGKQQKFIWYQVSINKTVYKFMKNYPDDMTEFEEGILYGFPLSAIRAFAGLIKENRPNHTPENYYLAGVCSADFIDDEQEYYQKWWKRLAKLSPKTIKKAESEYYQNH